MNDLMECTRCGHLFCEGQAGRRMTMKPVRHARPGDCEPAEYAPSCPECCCLDLDEPMLSAADLEARLVVMYPHRSIGVEVEAYRFVHGDRTERSMFVRVAIEAPPADADGRPVTATGRTLRAAMCSLREAEARRSRNVKAETRSTSAPHPVRPQERPHGRHDNGD